MQFSTNAKNNFFLYTMKKLIKYEAQRVEVDSNKIAKDMKKIVMAQ